MVPSDSSHALGRRLKALRMQRAMTQREFAELCGVHRTQLVVYERGDVMPSFKVCRRIADTLGIRAGWLVTGTGDKLKGDKDQ